MTFISVSTPDTSRAEAGRKRMDRIQAAMDEHRRRAATGECSQDWFGCRRCNPNPIPR
jgi:hypothetical protein